MQMSQQPPRLLLTALEVQEMLHIDRSTVYRMAEDGRLPAIRVGRSWRFPVDRIEALLAASQGSQAEGRAPGQPDPAAGPEGSAGPGPSTWPRPTAGPEPTGGPSLTLVQADGPTGRPEPAGVSGATAGPDGAGAGVDLSAARAAVEVAADLLGVMMVVTDMHGRPLTPVVNQCPRFADQAADPAALARCIDEWRDLADHPDLSPSFQDGALGFQCARAFVRSGRTLVGMVLAGGVSPRSSARTDRDLHHLDDAGRARVLAALPRIAAAISPVGPRRAADRDPATSTAATKENR